MAGSGRAGRWLALLSLGMLLASCGPALRSGTDPEPPSSETQPSRPFESAVG
ncbi:MAG: hypothetical protein ACKO5F_10280 [Synechococcus sp.]